MKYRAGISSEEYAAMEDGYEQGLESARETIRAAKAQAWDECLATVTRGVERARQAHAEHGHRQIVSALIGLEGAIPRTENPYAGEERK